MPKLVVSDGKFYEVSEHEEVTLSQIEEAITDAERRLHTLHEVRREMVELGATLSDEQQPAADEPSEPVEAEVIPPANQPEPTPSPEMQLPQGEVYQPVQGDAQPVTLPEVPQQTQDVPAEQAPAPVTLVQPEAPADTQERTFA